MRILFGAALVLAFACLVDGSSFARSHKSKKASSSSATSTVVPAKPADTAAGANGAGTAAATVPPADAAAGAATAAPAAAAAAKAKPPPAWTEAEITAAKAHCTEVLARIHAVAVPHEPIKEKACGAPAPIELTSIGKDPEVSLSPPAIVTCDLAETLVKWLEDDLQPLARKHFKSEIIRIDTMSSYSCRNAYGRKTTFLSEHALANALDIGDFVTASAKTASVLEGWGTPQREILARLAAEKAAAERAFAEKVAADKAAQANLAKDGKSTAETPPAATDTPLGQPAAGIAKSTIIDGIPKTTVTLPGAARKSRKAGMVAVAEPDRLGGPKHGEAQVDSGRRHHKVELPETSRFDTPDTEVQGFLHEAHAAACNIFGTTLGPEANADHRNHFHVDMAPRKYKKICD